MMMGRRFFPLESFGYDDYDLRRWGTTIIINHKNLRAIIDFIHHMAFSKLFFCTLLIIAFQVLP